MIKGFEKITYELSDLEEDIALFVYKTLKENPDKPKTNSELCLLYNRSSICLYRNLSPRIRKIIHHIRESMCENDEFIIATSKGYELTRDIGKLHDYEISLKQRISSQLCILDGLEKRLRGGVSCSQ